MNRKSFVVAMLMMAALFLSAGSRLPAQTETTGAVTGTVSDPSGAAVPGATITLQDIAKGVTLATSSGAEGAFRFDLLLPGDYAITVKATGFETLSQKVSVRVGQVASLDLRLTLGAQTQTITVEAGAPLIQVETANVSSTINEIQAQNIPNPGNDITYIAQLAPGSSMNTGMGYGNFASYGISAVSNLFTINGMDDNDPFLNLNDSGATNLLLGQNEIEEVSIVTNGYSGEFGGLAGANINYITRSGTNDFHGRITWYWNGRALNANSFFNNITDTPRGFVNANQYGADFGGPLVKNKVFFYVNAEGLYLLIPTSVPVYVPSPQFETAVQDNIAATFPEDAAIQAYYAEMFKVYNGAPGINRATSQGLPDLGCDGSESAFNGVVEGYNFGSGVEGGLPCSLTFRSTAGNATHENLQAGRFDWNVTNNDRFFVRIQRDVGIQATFTDPINPGFNANSYQPEWQGQANETHTFANGAVNQMIFSGSWYSAIFKLENLAAANALFPQTLLFLDGALTTLNGEGDDWPQGRNVTQFQFSDDFSKAFGAHTLKVGYKYRRNWISNHDYGLLTNGLVLPFNLASLFFSYGLAEQAFPTFSKAPFHVYNTGGYVEDDWKVNPNLTLTFAFRLDHASNPICATNCFVRAATEFPDLSASPNTPYDQLLHVNQSQLLPSLTTVEPQPRFGFAWQPHAWGIKNTVLRGGVGIFYDNYPGVALDAISENGPNEPTFLVGAGTISSSSDPSSLLATAAGNNTAFRTGFANGSSFNQIVEADPSFSAPNMTVAQNNPKTMRVYKWSLGIEHQMGTNTSFTVQYVGNHSSNILFQNAGINGCNNVIGAPGFPEGGFASLPACNLTSGAGVNPNFLTVTYDQSIGNANFNGLEASLTHRYGSGQFQINYLWSHDLDDVSDSGILPYNFVGPSYGQGSVLFPENPANPKLYNYGSSDYDARHQLNANYVWELPIKHYITRGHGPDRLLNGWDVNGAVFFRTGLPETPVDLETSGDLSGAGYGATVFATQVAPGGVHDNCRTLYGNMQPNTSDCIDNIPVGSHFTTSPGGFPTLLRNDFTSPSYWDTDFSLVKHTKITERVEFVFGAQFYNIFNHPNFAEPIMDASNPRFGTQTTTINPPTTLYGSFLGADASSRLIQLKTQIVF